VQIFIWFVKNAFVANLLKRNRIKIQTGRQFHFSNLRLWRFVGHNWVSFPPRFVGPGGDAASSIARTLARKKFWRGFIFLWSSGTDGNVSAYYVSESFPLPFSGPIKTFSQNQY
jgi:hypothetical protein